MSERFDVCPDCEGDRYNDGDTIQCLECGQTWESGDCEN